MKRFFQFVSILAVLLELHGGTPVHAVLETTLPQFGGNAIWQGFQGQQMANIFTSCMNFSVPLQSMMMTVGQMQMNRMMPGAGGAMGSMGGGVCPLTAGAAISPSTPCPGSEVPPDVSQINCELLGYNPGQSSMMLQQMQAQIEMSLCTLNCKKAKVDAVRGEIQCYGAQASTLSQQVASLQTLFTQNLQKFQGDVAMLKRSEADRVALLEDVTSKLGGSKDNGTPGLMALKQQTVALLTAMPKEIQVIQKRTQDAKQMYASVEQQKVLVQAGLMMNCFNTYGQATYHCDPNDAPKNAKDYLACRYERGLMVSGRTILRDSTSKAQAAKGGKELSLILQQMTEGTPKITDIPNTSDELNALAKQRYLVKTPADVIKRYGPQLSKYNIKSMDGKNVSVLAFVQNIMTQCDKKSATEVRNMANTKDSPIDKQMRAAREFEQDTSADVANLFNKYNQQYSENMSGLSGQPMSLNLASCKNSSAATQVNCLKDIQRTMEGQLQGTTKNSAMLIQIKGSTTSYEFTCNGINGCITGLQNTSKNIKIEQKKLADYKQQYITSANLSTEGFTKQIAQQLTPMSQMLNQKLRDLNGALGSLGAQGINIPPLRGEPLKYDKDGLVQQPTSALALVGQYVNPPIPDVAGNSMSSAAGSLAGAEQRFNQNMAQMTNALARIQYLPQQCQQSMAGQRMDQLQTLLTQLSSADCRTMDRTRCRSLMQRVNASVNRIAGSPSTQMVDLDSALAGTYYACQGPTLGQHRNDPNNPNNAFGYIGGYDNCEMIANQIEAKANQVSRLQGVGGRAGSAR